MRCLIFLSLIWVIFGCRSSAEKNLPHGLVKDSIIPQPEMINILADVHVLEAALQIQRNKNEDINAMEDFYYKNLFSKYRMNRKRFELNLNYYEMDLDNFRKMYEEVGLKLEASSRMPNPHK